MKSVPNLLCTALQHPGVYCTGSRLLLGFICCLLVVDIFLYNAANAYLVCNLFSKTYRTKLVGAELL